MLLKQLASLSDKWSVQKNHHVFCLRKLSHLSIKYKELPMLSLLFPTSSKILKLYFLKSSHYLLMRILKCRPICLCVCFPFFLLPFFQPISGRVDRASATEAVDSGSIPGRVKPKTIKIGIHSFPA